MPPKFPDEYVFERLVSTPEARKAYRTSALFSALASAVRAHAGQEDEIVLLGRLLAQVCESREKWIGHATQELSRLDGNFWLAEHKGHNLAGAFGKTMCLTCNTECPYNAT